jgi:hypothetical protein
MFNTINATRTYVPVHDRAKTYAYGYKSPRAKRFVASIRQLVHHDGATNAGSNPASLVVDESLKICASNNNNPGFSDSPTLEDNIAKTQSK